MTSPGAWPDAIFGMAGGNARDGPNCERKL
jgi:hypothetical protein